MKRKPMKRTPLKRSKSVKKRNPERKAKSFTRAYGSPERVEWFQKQACLVCSERPCENAHVKSGGMGRKADAQWIVPLCHSHHHELHTKGKDTFEAQHFINLDLWALILDSRYWQELAIAREAQ